MLGQMDYEYSSYYSDPGYMPDPTAAESEWGDWLIQAAKIWTEYDLQQKMLEINLERAQQNLPPLDLSRYGMGVQVGMTQQTQTVVLLVVGIIAGALVLPKLLRR